LVYSMFSRHPGPLRSCMRNHIYTYIVGFGENKNDDTETKAKRGH
jgi:hypothetical protein